ncbi:hypothetical protein OG285_32460 [Streptomyces sp. NBC_01471]|uniref:hypothetical protein n=1 Tax=Streptomyces sp. NBC_01471 TaxID=2903879 RepID=UPI003255C8F1
MTQPTAPALATKQITEQLIQDAAAFIEKHRADIYGQDEVPFSEAICRLFASRNMLTSHDQREAEREQLSTEFANYRQAHVVLNHVPVKKHHAELKRAAMYIAALERVTAVLLSQIDGVADLAGVKKTAKGRILLEQSIAARTYADQAHCHYRADGEG